MLLAGKAANGAGVPVVLDPVGAGATRYRTDTARRLSRRGGRHSAARQPGRGRHARRRAGRGARSRVDRRRRASRPSSHEQPRRKLGLVAPVTGVVDYVSDGAAAPLRGQRSRAAGLGDRHRLHVERDHRLLPRRQARRAARGCGRGARGVRRRRRGRGAAMRRGRARSTSVSTTRWPVSIPTRWTPARAGSHEAARDRRRARDRPARSRGRSDRRAVAAEGRAASSTSSSAAVQRGASARVTACRSSSTTTSRQR